MLNLGHMPNTVGNLYVKTYDTDVNGYVDITVPAATSSADRKSLMVYGDGNGYPFFGVVVYKPTTAYSYIAKAGTETGTGTSVTLINSTTLRLTVVQWSKVYVISSFKVS